MGLVPRLEEGVLAASFSAFPTADDWAMWKATVVCPAGPQPLAGAELSLLLQFDLEGHADDDGLPSSVQLLCFRKRGEAEKSGSESRHPNIDADGFVSANALRARCAPLSALRSTLVAVADIAVRPCFAVAPSNEVAAASWFA